MWWYFEKANEDNDIVTYNYSRENRILDGLISIDKNTGMVSMVSPCSNDSENDFAINKAISKAFFLVKEGYPANRQVACG